MLFISLLAALVSLRAADPKVEFSGVLTADGKTKLALTNKTTGATTWVEPGESYQGYTVARYDPKEDAVFLKKDGEETRLGLIAAKSPVAAATTAAATSPSTDAAATAIRANLRLLAAAARRYQLDRGVTTATYADLVGPGKSIPELRSVAGENYSGLTFPAGGSTVGVAMTDGTQVSVDVPATTAQPVAPVTPAAPATTVAPTANVAALPPAPPATAPTASSAEPLPATTAAAPAQALEPTGRPAETPSSYTTAANETWETVAQKNGVTVDKLKELNPTVISPSSLPEGQPLRIRK